MLKVICVILAVIVIFMAGYMVVNSAINLFKGYSIAAAFEASWHDLTHLWGLIGDKIEADVIYPMANRNVIWGYANAPRQ